MDIYNGQKVGAAYTDRSSTKPEADGVIGIGDYIVIKKNDKKPQGYRIIKNAPK